MDCWHSPNLLLIDEDSDASPRAEDNGDSVSISTSEDENRRADMWRAMTTVTRRGRLLL